MKTEYLHIRVSPQLKEQAKEAAKKEGKGLSEWVLDLIKIRIAKESY